MRAIWHQPESPRGPHVSRDALSRPGMTEDVSVDSSDAIWRLLPVTPHIRFRRIRCPLRAPRIDARRQDGVNTYLAWTSMGTLRSHYQPRAPQPGKSVAEPAGARAARGAREVRLTARSDRCWTSCRDTAACPRTLPCGSHRGHRDARRETAAAADTETLLARRRSGHQFESASRQLKVGWQ